VAVGAVPRELIVALSGSIVIVADNSICAPELWWLIVGKALRIRA
jgi:hypothetical protein